MGSSVGQDVTRPWADLPPELLSIIAEKLGLIELLSFRGVCKAWRISSSTASAETESANNLEPSFLAYGSQVCYAISFIFIFGKNNLFTR